MWGRFGDFGLSSRVNLFHNPFTLLPRFLRSRREAERERGLNDLPEVHTNLPTREGQSVTCLVVLT
jgi:hypothetical protein